MQCGRSQAGKFSILPSSNPFSPPGACDAKPRAAPANQRCLAGRDGPRHWPIAAQAATGIRWIRWLTLRGGVIRRDCARHVQGRGFLQQGSWEFDSVVELTSDHLKTGVAMRP